MLITGVLYELIFAVVTNTTRVTHIGLLIGMSSLMVVPVSNSSEPFDAVLAFVGLFPSVDSHVYK